MANKESFEEALTQLEAIVQQLERADIPLEDALKQFKTGIELSQYCKKTLSEAEKTITTLILDSDEEKELVD